MSFILRPNLISNDAVLITTAASVAVARAIEEVTQIHTGIKWVNDIYINGKKICGILTEALTDFESGSIESIILGIGINFSTAVSCFPESIQQKQIHYSMKSLPVSHVIKLLQLSSIMYFPYATICKTVLSLRNTKHAPLY